jgi:SAM-dependent methyltransferase
MDFRDRIHPERGVAGFTKLDGTVRFYNFVKAAMARIAAKKVLDFGAGRGGTLETDIPWRRQLQDLRQLGAEVWAADIDPVVRSHPASDHQVVLEPTGPLPFPDEFFDLIVSDWTFEHIAEPEMAAAELLRIVRPGGFICARTSNKFGYIKLAASAVPNRLHKKALEIIQPGRRHEDIFPTVYKMNSIREIRRLFPGCEVWGYRDNSEPAYFFNNPLLYRLFLAVHWILPDSMATILQVFIRKPSSVAE